MLNDLDRSMSEPAVARLHDWVAERVELRTLLKVDEWEG